MPQPARFVQRPALQLLTPKRSARTGGHPPDNARDDDFSLFLSGWRRYLLGGLCIGGGVAMLFLLTGRIGGVAEVFSRRVGATWCGARSSAGQVHRYAPLASVEYALGLILARWCGGCGWAMAPAKPAQMPWWLLLAGGFSPVTVPPCQRLHLRPRHLWSGFAAAPPCWPC